MRTSGSDSSFRYRIQRSERPYNWSLFRGLFLIGVSLVVISLNVRLEFGKTLTSYMVLPLDYGYQWTRNRVLSGGDAVVRHWDTASKLEDTAEENERLRENLARLQLEVEQYRAMAASWPLHLYFDDQRTLPASVIRVTGDPLRRTLLLDRGHVHGLARYMPAVVPGASGEPVLVGRIVEVRPYVSLLLLIDDPQCAVAAAVGDVQGMVMGTGTGCVLKVSKDVNLPEGAPVFTSGRGIYYPPNLYIGRIASPHSERVSLDQVYPVETPFTLDELRYVLVLPNLYREDALEWEGAR